jgi:ribose 5-phosphate isomerase B
MIYIAADHAGFDLKERIKTFLKTIQLEVKDFGTYSSESMDYPDVIHPIAKEIDKKENQKGIIICGSGNGVNMVANKYKNVRSALCWNVEIAQLARQHNNANILAIPARFISEDMALQIVSAFITTDFEGGRHQTRVEKI